MVELSSGIYDTARSLGMDPVDLATIISYETGGTFDPTKAGPTTQWGQHRGLIQFGEPQAEQYGVNWDDPVGSQLGENGAVARYFRENGWKPGMGMEDAYSIVNAGGPGRGDRTDENNGGAPGTVVEKVRNQMADHRRNAERLLSGGGYDTASGGEPYMQRPSQRPQQGQRNALAYMPPPEYRNALDSEPFMLAQRKPLSERGLLPTRVRGSA